MLFYIEERRILSLAKEKRCEVSDSGEEHYGSKPLFLKYEIKQVQYEDLKEKFANAVNFAVKGGLFFMQGIWWCF